MYLENLNNILLKFHKKPTLKYDTILQIFYQICLGVSDLHNFSPPITHRDLKVFFNIINIILRLKIFYILKIKNLYCVILVV